MSQKRDPALPTYGQIARFFLPLSLTSLIIVLSHSVVNAGVARTKDPEIALAAYALARGLVLLIENPMFMVRQTVVSLVKDRASFLLVQKFLYGLALGIMVLLALMGFTPLGLWVLVSLMGASYEIAIPAHAALKVLFLLPLTTVSRNLYHGIAILAKQTLLVPYSTTLRLLTMSGLIFFLASYTEIPGAVAGSLSFVGAFFVEATVMRKKAKPLLHSSLFPQEAPGVPLDYSSISRFFLPLVVTAFVATSFGPLINAGLARGAGAEIALAAYAVGHGLGLIFLAPIGMLHQCTLTFTKPSLKKSYGINLRFILAFSLFSSFLLAFLAFSPLGSFVLARLMGVSLLVEQSAQKVLRVMVLMPFLYGIREYLWGILMQKKETSIIGTAKALNLLAVILALVLLLASERVPPATAGAWAMVFGEIVDCGVMQLCITYRAKKKALTVPSP